MIDQLSAFFDHLFHRHPARTCRSSLHPLTEWEEVGRNRANVPQAGAWPPGLIERTAGAWQGAAPVREGHEQYEAREPL